MIVTQITNFLILQGNKIIQNEKCQFLCKSSQARCPPCVQFRSTLTVHKSHRKHQDKNMKTDPQTTTRYSISSKSEMKTRMKIMHNELCKIKKQRDRLIKKIEVLLDSNNLKLNPVDNEDIKNIILKEGEKNPGKRKFDLISEIVLAATS